MSQQKANFNEDIKKLTFLRNRPIDLPFGDPIQGQLMKVKNQVNVKQLRMRFWNSMVVIHVPYM